MTGPDYSQADVVVILRVGNVNRDEFAGATVVLARKGKARELGCASGCPRKRGPVQVGLRASLEFLVHWGRSRTRRKS